MVVIVDYGMGNFGSILNMLKKIGINAIVSSSISNIEVAEKLILPGVGAFDTGMQRLNELNLVNILNYKVLTQKIPTLGLCLGMQLCTKFSEEGKLPGLGWIDGETIRFRFDPKKENLKIPHMGWNTISIQRDSGLVKDMNNDFRFYFVHSFHVICNNPDDILTTTYYGYQFASTIQHENIYGTQFHPEKSHKYGMQILKNFIENN